MRIHGALAAGGLLLGLAAAAATAAAAPADPEAGAAQRGAAASQPDFLFGQPGSAFGVRLHWNRARARGGVHDFLTDFLTLKPRDFDALGVAFDVGFALTPRLDARFGLDYVRTPETASEFRRFVGSDGLPIRQETTLQQADLNASVAFALLPRGRAIGRYVWIPGAFVPYVGAGAGLQRYALDVVGEFVDQNDLSIFESHLRASGWTPSVHLLGGADIRLLQRLYLSVEARYVRATADPGGAFERFDTFDLSGLRAGAGIRFFF